MDQNLQRLAAATHYVIARTDPSELGATKLYKVLWYADIEYYRRHGRSITGLTHYVRMPQGPMPKGVGRVLSSLKREGDIYERETKVYSHTRREFVWLKEPNISAFDGEQIDILQQVIDLICEHTADVVSESTHDALWHELGDGDPMPIGAGSIVPKAPSKKQLEWARSQAEAY